jgi:hypothetical protein
MNLDETLGSEYLSAIDMGVIPPATEADDKYKALEVSQFADPANRAFPCNTAERCRSAMVYLNKYYNNPASGGVTQNYSKSKFKQVHDKIVAFMKKYGIEHKGCSIENSKASDNTKGGIEDMPEIEETTEEVEETEATSPEEELTTEEEISEETEASEEEVVEEEATDEETEASEEEAVAEVTEETTNSEETEEPVEEVASDERSVGFKIKELLTELSNIAEELERPNEVEASEEEDAVTKLSRELAEAHTELAEYKCKELGSGRIYDLTQAGITFKEDTLIERVARLGKMSEEEFEAYKSDLVSVASVEPQEEPEVEKTEASTGEKKTTGIETPPMFLPIVEDPEKKSQTERFKELYRK